MNLKHLFVALIVFLSSATAFAQSAGETVSLGLVSSPYCGGGYELKRLDRGPEGQYTPTNVPFVVPSGLRLEITDLSYEVQSLTSAEYAQQLLLSARDRQSGVVFDSLSHEHAFDLRYKQDSAGVYRTEGALSSRWGSYHVSFASGLLVSSKARACVTLSTPHRMSNIVFRGRLVSAPASGAGTTVTTTSNYGFAMP